MSSWSAEADLVQPTEGQKFQVARRHGCGEIHGNRALIALLYRLCGRVQRNRYLTSAVGFGLPLRDGPVR